MSDLPESALVVQPENRGTGIAIAAAVSVLLQRDPDALVAFFPCDHHYADEAAFLHAVDAGFAAVQRNPSKIVLLGAEPRCPETEYGWIEPWEPPLHFEPSRVRRFWEKPSSDVAERLMQAGGMWNTFVTIGRAFTFLNLLCAAAPDTMLALSEELLDSNFQPTYRSVPFVDFCRDVLSRQADRLLVIRDADSGWTDLGKPSRVLDTLTVHNMMPAWLETVPQAMLRR